MVKFMGLKQLPLVVGGWTLPPEKYEWKSTGMMKFPIDEKNIKCSKPPTRCGVGCQNGNAQIGAVYGKPKFWGWICLVSPKMKVKWKHREEWWVDEAKDWMKPGASVRLLFNLNAEVVIFQETVGDFTNQDWHNLKMGKTPSIGNGHLAKQS